MMTDATAQKSARQVLGEALRFYREQRGYNQARVADIAKVSRNDVDDWEAGRAVPPSAQWELLKKMVHRGLSQLGAVRQRAFSEVDAERALVQRSMQRAKTQQAPPPPAADKPLTSRPFADVLAKAPILKIVPDPKPEPPKPAPAPTTTQAPITTPPGVPATLMGDTFDLSDAYTAVNTLPDGWGTTEAKEARAAFAKDLLKQGLDAEVIVARTREKFTVGISRVTLKKLRAEIEREAAKAERKAQREAAKMQEPVEAAAPPPPPAPVAPPPESDAALVDYARMVLSKSPSIKIDELIGQLTAKFKRSLPSQQLYILRTEAKVAWNAKTTPTPEATVQPMKDPAPVSAPAPKTVNTADIETAAQLVLGAIPNLRTFTITVDDAGEVTVSHTTREVRVVEASGSIKLKR
jgi:DNA-binding transcriptional regulator YiaG